MYQNILSLMLSFSALFGTIIGCWVIFYKLCLHKIDFVNEILGFKKKVEYQPSVLMDILNKQESKEKSS